MELLKGTTRGEDLFLKVTGAIDRFELPRNKLTDVTIDGSPNLTGKNVGLPKRLQDKMNEEKAGVDITFLHCIIHQEALCKSLLQLNNVVKAVVKLIVTVIICLFFYQFRTRILFVLRLYHLFLNLICILVSIYALL